MSEFPHNPQLTSQPVRIRPGHHHDPILLQDDGGPGRGQGCHGGQGHSRAHGGMPPWPIQRQVRVQGVTVQLVFVLDEVEAEDEGAEGHARVLDGEAGAGG